MKDADTLAVCDLVRGKPFADPLKFLPKEFERSIYPAWRANLVADDAAPCSVSIVTAFFDLGRSNWQGEVNGRPIHGSQIRSNEQYLTWFNNLARMKNQMIILTERKFVAPILEMRRKCGLEPITSVMVCDGVFAPNGPLIQMIGLITQSIRPEFQAFVRDPALPEYWNAKYIMMTHLKSVLVCSAIRLGLNLHRQVAWMDFGYCRDDRRFEIGVPWRFDCRERMNLFYMREPDNRPVFDIVRTGDVYFQAGVIVGPAERWFRFTQLMDEAISSLLSCGLVDDEQTAMVMSYRREPELFRINAVNSPDWFSVLRKFHHEDRAPEPLASFVAGRGRSDVVTAARALAEDGLFVEVGTFKADFAERLLLVCEPRRLYCVDPYEKYADYNDTMNTCLPLDVAYHFARARMARFSNRVEFIKAYSADAAEKFSDGSVDFIYIDANHAFQYVYQDLCLWHAKLKVGGLICGGAVFDIDEPARNAEGNIEIVWERDAEGNVTSGGEYGVLKAVRAFCSERGIEFLLSGTEFLLQKKG
jgi:protein YibB